MAWSVVSEWWLHAMARHEGVLVIALWPAVAMHWQRASATSVHFGGDNLLLGQADSQADGETEGSGRGRIHLSPMVRLDVIKFKFRPGDGRQRQAEISWEPGSGSDAMTRQGLCPEAACTFSLLDLEGSDYCLLDRSS